MYSFSPSNSSTHRQSAGWNAVFDRLELFLIAKTNWSSNDFPLALMYYIQYVFGKKNQTFFIRIMRISYQFVSNLQTIKTFRIEMVEIQTCSNRTDFKKNRIESNRLKIKLIRIEPVTKQTSLKRPGSKSYRFYSNGKIIKLNAQITLRDEPSLKGNIFCLRNWILLN